MIHNDIQNQLALLVKTSAPPLIEVAQSPVESPQWTPGQRVPAFVLASLPNGRFQVQVEDQILDMNLPRQAEPGEKLELTYLTSSPRLTFALSQDLERALPANSGVSLSQTAKFLGALLQRGGATENGRAPALTNSTAILPGAPAAIQDFAVALRTAVAQSGLFYESHQAQWVTGERSLTSLLQEPQARLPGISDVPQKEQAGAQPGQTLAALPKTAADALGNAPLMTALGQHDADGGVNLPRDMVHPQAVPLVHQQLDTLDTRQIVWQGQVWPGQQMDWRIEEDESSRTSAEDDEQQWRTRLHLDMPSLGGVTARLAFAASGVRIEMVAEKGQSAALLRGAVGRLAVSMEASGLKVAGLTVREDGGN